LGFFFIASNMWIVSPTVCFIVFQGWPAVPLLINIKPARYIELAVGQIVLVEWVVEFREISTELVFGFESGTDKFSITPSPWIIRTRAVVGDLRQQDRIALAGVDLPFHTVLDLVPGIGDFDGGYSVAADETRIIPISRHSLAIAEIGTVGVDVNADSRIKIIIKSNILRAGEQNI
jgi:hypothetical protein